MQCTEPLVFHRSAHIIRLERRRCTSYRHLVYSCLFKVVCSKKRCMSREISPSSSDDSTQCEVTVMQGIGRRPREKYQGFRESPGRTGQGWVETRKGKEVLRASTVHLCPASWQPVWKASVLRVSYSGRSWSSFEALRSWPHDCYPVACCPPANVTDEQLNARPCIVGLYGSATRESLMYSFIGTHLNDT